MEAMKQFVCSPEAGQAAKDAGLFGESVWVWRQYTTKDGITHELAKRDKWTNPFDVPAVMLEEAMLKLPTRSRVVRNVGFWCCEDPIPAEYWISEKTSAATAAVRLAVGIKEGQK